MIGLSLSLGMASGGTPTPAAPSAFVGDGWAAYPTGVSGQIGIELASLPSANGESITSVEYRIDGGSAVALAGIALNTPYLVNGLTDDVAVTVEIRAVNGIGAGAWSVPRPVIPFAPDIPAMLDAGEWTLDAVPASTDLALVISRAAADETALLTEIDAIEQPAATLAALAAGPVNLDPPTISGTPALGATMTLVRDDRWLSETGVTGYAIAWERDGTPIGGATASTYVWASADADAALTVVVTATDAQGSTASESAETRRLASADIISLRADQTFGIGMWADSTSGHAAFETWLGAPADVASYHVHKDSDWSWAQYTITNASYAQAYMQTGRKFHWSVPMLVVTGGGTLVQAAAGDFDTQYALMATNILSVHPDPTGKIMIRPGWEFNGDWFPWTIQPTSGEMSGLTTGEIDALVAARAANFATAFQRLVTQFRAASDRFVFEWCPNQPLFFNGSFINVELAYPGDTYVDIIGMDYYQEPGNDGFFGYVRDSDYGLTWQVAFAAAHYKLLSFPEFGIGASTDTSPTINEPARIAAWLADNDYAYATYWDSSSDYDGKLSDGGTPLAGAEFIEHFGAPVITSSSTSTVAEDIAFSMSLAASQDVVWTLEDNAAVFVLDGTSLTRAASSTTGDVTVTIRATNTRGLSVTQVFTLTVAAVPGWVLAGAVLDMDFKNSQYYGATVSDLTVTRAGGFTAPTSGGTSGAFDANTPRITDLGFYCNSDDTSPQLDASILPLLTGAHTVYIEFTTEGAQYDYPHAIAYGVSSSNKLTIIRGDNWRANTEYRIGGTKVAEISPATANINSGVVAKVASRIEADNVQSAVNGTLGTVDTSATALTTPTVIGLGADINGANQINGFIRRIAIFSTPLSDGTLTTLST